MSFSLWKSAMMAGLLEPPRELEFLEPFPETMSLKYKI